MPRTWHHPLQQFSLPHSLQDNCHRRSNRQTLPLYTSPEIGKQPATIDQFLSFPSWASFLRKLCQRSSKLSWPATVFFLKSSLPTAPTTLWQTEDALAFIVNRLLLERDCGKATGLVFVDLSKAFDRVKHQALIDLLLGIGICDTGLKWFANYLSDRQQRVRVGNRFSSQSACSRGVPQGSVLGPLLFTLYVRDLPSCVDVKVLMFADDILLFYSGFSIPEIACRLTNAVTSLDSWLTTRGLQINIEKTQAMFVLPKVSTFLLTQLWCATLVHFSLWHHTSILVCF